MTALVCGGRDYRDYKRLCAVLGVLGPTVVVHGGARGADSLAGAWAASHGVPSRVYKADWKKHGKAAGVIRNGEMLEGAAPDVVVAFPGGRGTADMVRRARAARVEVVEV